MSHHCTDTSESQNIQSYRRYSNTGNQIRQGFMQWLVNCTECLATEKHQNQFTETSEWYGHSCMQVSNMYTWFNAKLRVQVDRRSFHPRPTPELSLYNFKLRAVSII